MKKSFFLSTLSLFTVILTGLGGLLLPWYPSLAAAPFVNPTPLWRGESDSASARLSQVAFGDFNGDHYADLAALSPDWSNPETVEGAIFVWQGSASGLGANGTPGNAAWKAETQQSGAHFAAVTTGDVNGDGYDDLIAASTWYNNGQSSEGVVWVWLGSASGLGAEGTPANADWLAESNVVVGLFGTSLTTGDVNGDGYADLGIGASSLSNGQANEGRTFVYLGSSSGLGVNGTPANADWTSESNQASASWGSALTTGDFNGDSYADLAIGAPNYDNGQTDEGQVFVFHGSSTGLGATGTPTNADWSAQSDQASARLGGALATGLLNGDAYVDLTMAAYTYDNGQTDEGLVMAFMGSSIGLGAGGLPSNADWQAESDQATATMSALAVGDLTQDGYADVLIGFKAYDNGETDEGAAFLWHGAASGLGANGTPTNADALFQADQASAWLGEAAAIGQAYGPLWSNVLALSAWKYENGQTGEGAVFVFGIGPLPPTATPTNTPVTPTNTPTHTATWTPSPTATRTPTPSNTPVTLTNTPTNTATWTPSPTATRTPTPSNTPVTPTNTPTHTATWTPSPTASNTATPSATPSTTPCPLTLCTATPTPTNTATPSATPSTTPCPLTLCTATPTPTNTATPSATPSTTPCPLTLCTATPTPTNTATWTPSPTPTPTATLPPGCPCFIYLPLVQVEPPRVSEQEPNDLFAQAQALPVPGILHGTHDGAANTGDVYQITLQAGQIVEVVLSTDNPTGVQLLAYGGEAPDEIVRDFEAPHTLNFVATTTGTYYLYVFTPDSANNPAAYTLRVVVTE